MAVLKSILIPLGTKMPHFSLGDPNGKIYKSDTLYGPRGLLLGFFCNHCPYALAVWPRYIALAKHAQSMRINTVAINPNIHPDYPQDSPDQMILKIKEWRIEFPYLVDETQEVARNFKAQCTPDIFLFNQDQELVYHGRIDDNWQNPEKVTREELKEAINNLVTGQPQAADQMPCMGCSIKWRN